MSFGTWLSAQMAACGFTTNMALERKTGIDNTTISRWRSDQMTPGMDHLRKLEGPLKTPYMQLLVRAGYVSPEEAKVRRDVPPRESGRPASPLDPSPVVTVAKNPDERTLALVRPEQPADDDDEENEVLAAVRRDPNLDEDARDHYLNQYKLLREMTAARRAAAAAGAGERPRYVARGQATEPVSEEEQRRIAEFAAETSADSDDDTDPSR